MKKPSLNIKRAKTGTNLRRNPVPAYRAKQLAEQAEIFGKALNLYRKHSRKLFTRAERRIAVPYVIAARQALQRAILQKSQDAAKHADLKRQHRRKLDRELARVLPNFKIWQRLNRDYLRHWRQVAKLGFENDLQLGLLGDLDIDPVDPQHYSPPFLLYDTRLTSTSSAPVIEDLSVVVPENGHMQNRFTFDHDGDSGFGIDAWFQLERAVLAAQSVACGIHYTVPQTGRLQIHAVLQNYVSRVAWSVTDLFGLSFGKLLVEQRLVIRIIRRDRTVISLVTTLLFSGVNDSPGIDIPLGLLPTFDNSLPYDLEGTTEEVFTASENLQIFVESEIFIRSDMNDMASHVDALVWWHLQQISVSVV